MNRFITRSIFFISILAVTVALTGFTNHQVKATPELSETEVDEIGDAQKTEVKGYTCEAPKKKITTNDEKIEYLQRQYKRGANPEQASECLTLCQSGICGTGSGGGDQALQDTSGDVSCAGGICYDEDGEQFTDPDYNPDPTAPQTPQGPAGPGETPSPPSTPKPFNDSSATLGDGSGPNSEHDIGATPYCGAGESCDPNYGKPGSEPKAHFEPSVNQESDCVGGVCYDDDGTTWKDPNYSKDPTAPPTKPTTPPKTPVKTPGSGPSAPPGTGGVFNQLGKAFQQMFTGGKNPLSQLGQGLMKALGGQGLGQGGGDQQSGNSGQNNPYNDPYQEQKRQDDLQKQLKEQKKSTDELEKKLKEQEDKNKELDKERKEALEKLEQQNKQLEDQLKQLQKKQVEDVFKNQKKPTGDRPVTIIAGPETDPTGKHLIGLINSVRKVGHDVIVLPDSADYQSLMDKVLAEVKVLQPNVPVNCVGWGKGAVGCIALAKQADEQGRNFNHVVLIDPGQGIDGPSVPGVSNSDLATNEIELDVTGKVTLIIPDRDSMYAVYEALGGEIIADDTRVVSTAYGALSIGLDKNVQNIVVAIIASGETKDDVVGNVFNIAGDPLALDGDKASAYHKDTGISGASLADGGVKSPLSLWGSLGTTIGNFLGFGGESDPDKVLTEEELQQEIDDLMAYIDYLQYMNDVDAWSADKHTTVLGYIVADELGYTDQAAPNSAVGTDLSVVALRSDRTLGEEYRFRGAIRIDQTDDREYRGPDLINELALDLGCDGTVDAGAFFVTPYYSLRSSSANSDVLISEYLPVYTKGLHCFSFVIDIDNDLAETNESNNISEWREFIVGFGNSVATTSTALPPLNFEVSAYTSDYETMVREWTGGDIIIAPGQQLAFRWDAPGYESCQPLLSSLTPDVAGNHVPIERNTLTENTDLHEHTGYYELRCSINGDTRIETVHVTVQ